MWNTHEGTEADSYRGMVKFTWSIKVEISENSLYSSHYSCKNLLMTWKWANPLSHLTSAQWDTSKSMIFQNLKRLQSRFFPADWVRLGMGGFDKRIMQHSLPNHLDSVGAVLSNGIQQFLHGSASVNNILGDMTRRHRGIQCMLEHSPSALPLNNCTTTRDVGHCFISTSLFNRGH